MIELNIDLGFKLIGAIGLILITKGVIEKKRINAIMFFIGGGILLEIYSLYIQDIVFIILQLIFTIVAIHQFLKLKKVLK